MTPDEAEIRRVLERRPRAAARRLLRTAAPWAAAHLDALPPDGPHGAVLAERLRFGPPETWRGWRRGVGPVVVKLAPPLLADRRSGFAHPGVAPMIDHGDGWSLWRWIEGRPLGSVRDPAVIDAVAVAVSALHAAGLFHGDLTPANIVLAATGPVLIDWGEDCAGTPGWRPKGPHTPRERDLFALSRLRA